LVGAVAAVTLGGSAGLIGAAATAVPSSASLPLLTATGSSFAGVAITQWEGNFNEVSGGNVNFTVTSSVVGMNDFGCNQTVDVGATDISYSTGQANCPTNAVPFPFQYMPDVAGGLAFEYHLTASNGQQVKSLILNAPTLAGIFTGTINKWNDPAIQALNPSIALPNEAITAYYRVDPSGENYLLSDYMLHTDPSAITSFQTLAQNPTAPGQPSAYWGLFPNGQPSQTASLLAVQGSDAASQGPVHVEGGISYVETAYAKNVGEPVASIVNTAGNAVQPTALNVAVALEDAILYSDLTQNLGGVYTNPDADAYPISAYSYFVAQCVPAQAAAQNFSCDSSGNDTMGPAQGGEMAEFIHFVACQGQESMQSLGYSPLPVNLVVDDLQAAARLPGGITYPAPTAANCPNPYVTGQLQSVGGPQVVASSNPGGSDVGTTANSPAVAASSGNRGSTASSGPTTGPTTTVPGVISASTLKKQTQNPLTGPAANRRQLALVAAASRGLQGWSGTEVVLWSIVFILVLGAVPFGTWYLQRRRKRPEEESTT
jgi:ABC-type phosphate transport system substrate-binding protein